MCKDDQEVTEVTPRMIEAGVMALEDIGEASSAYLVREVYLEMARVSREERCKAPGVCRPKR